ncbi:MAG: RDD family protein [Candidatus Hodarchaeota archaeon]
MVTDQTSPKEEFINQVSYWLPYRPSRKEELLQELAQDLQSAYEDTSADLLRIERWKKVIEEFGAPKKVAEDLISNQADPVVRASYLLRVFAHLIDGFFVFGLLYIIWISVFFIAYSPLTLPFGIELYQLEVKFEERKAHSHSRLREYFSPSSVTQIFYVLYVATFEGAEITVRGDLFSIFLYYVVLTIYLVLLITVAIGYYAILESRYGRTIGKRLLRLRVVSESGVRISWQQAVTRNLSKILSQLLFFDWLASWFLKTNRQRAVELVAKTQVIYDR